MEKIEMNDNLKNQIELARKIHEENFGDQDRKNTEDLAKLIASIDAQAKANDFAKAEATANAMNTSKIKSRGWCVTINNPTDEDFIAFQGIDAQYKCYNVEHTEVGAGTPHIQGYIYFKTQRYFGGVKKELPRAHLLAAKGTTAQNKKYCSKEGKLDYEDGEAECDAKKIADSLTMTNEELRRTWPLWADRLIANRNKVNELKHAGFNKNKKVLYITGDSGYGKSKLARDIAGKSADTIECKNGFVNGYTNEEQNIVWDEFRDSDCKLNDFLKLTDKYSNRINTKNGTEIFYTNLLVITSIKHPDAIYKCCGESRKQINRRIDILDLNLEENAHLRHIVDEKAEDMYTKYNLPKG